MHRRNLLALAMVCLPAQLSAQAPATGRNPGRITITGYFGSTSAGASGDLIEAMHDNGYTDPLVDRSCSPTPSPGPCYPDEPGPQSSTAGARVHVSVRYRIGPSLAAEVLVGQATAGKAAGNRDGDRLSRRLDATMASTLVSVERRIRTTRRLPITLHAGAGPAVLRAKWETRDDAGFDRDRVKTTSVGAIGNVGVLVGLTRFLHIGVNGQYRLFGSTDLAAPPWSPGDGPTTVNLAHGFTGLGLGVSF